jgi:hypothetical protein
VGIERLFHDPLKVINVGLQSFAQDLRSAGVECQHVGVSPVERGDGQIARPDGAAGQTRTGEE